MAADAVSKVIQQIRRSVNRHDGEIQSDGRDPRRSVGSADRQASLEDLRRRAAEVVRQIADGGAR